MVTLEERLERRAERGIRRDPDEVLAEVRRDLVEGGGPVRAGGVGGAGEGVVCLSSNHARRPSAGPALVAAVAVVVLVVGVVAWRLTTDMAEESPVATESSATTVSIAEPDDEDVPQLAVDGWLWPATPTATSAEEARDDFLRDVLGVDPASVTAVEREIQTDVADLAIVGFDVTLPSGGEFGLDLVRVDPQSPWVVSHISGGQTPAWTDGETVTLSFPAQSPDRTGELLVAGPDGVTRRTAVDGATLQSSTVELDAWPAATLLLVRDDSGAVVDVLGTSHEEPGPRTEMTGLAPLLEEPPSEPFSVTLEVGGAQLTFSGEPSGRAGVQIQHPAMTGSGSVSTDVYDPRPLWAMTGSSDGDPPADFFFGAVGRNAAQVEVEDDSGGIHRAHTVEAPGLDGPRLFVLEAPTSFSPRAEAGEPRPVELRFLSDTGQVLYRHHMW